MIYTNSAKHLFLAIGLHIAIFFLISSSKASKSDYNLKNFNLSIKFISPHHDHAYSNDKSGPISNSLSGYAEKDSHELFKESSDFKDVIYDSLALKNKLPKYPTVAKRNGEEGLVLVEVLVGEDGRLRNLKIIKSSESEILDRAAVNAISEWSFIPAKKAGAAIISKIIIPINFKLNDVS